MTTLTAIRGARIFDGHDWHGDHTLLLGGDRIRAILPAKETLPATRTVDYDGLLVVPGFIDLQVNGGGGVQFGDRTSAEAIRQIANAHARFGTTRLLPTLITDTREVTEKALEAGRAARAEKVPGFLGLHLEGPHLSHARKGAHDPALIRPMEEPDLDRLLRYRREAGLLMTTVAPESVTLEQIATLAGNDVQVSIGHTDTTAKTALACFEAGARMVTHLFNAMSPLTHREPGLVGAALHDGRVFAGLIADGVHVDPVAMGIALRAKQGPGRIFLVTDAMAPLGTEMSEFQLNGRRIFRKDGRLTLADGTLAGADIDMLSSVRLLVERLRLPLDEALRMASLYPASAARIDGSHGRLAPGYVADFVALTPALDHVATWIDGVLSV
ncbi:N-acetylglucosamine-6-phosphate deacetylase [Hartmannibacter diazotrophicus]|uniref:N-acetylglucosamine-6-phosphate deacetylase n=1 Tax=Hartmannibacter diazotrophicus TaxID=1482074 RepID=A0A2C9DCS1_9HYPH|nr:N-acetylglucosamine-6-phosphate deacetylase [Hartmannibacter diazotrophicus]SON58122.1 N-acetylglucosamine-6-phosphate deacetylase [Hartmannibacter diazotrophicus]